MHDSLEEEGSDSSVNGNELQVQDVITKPRRISPVLELANRLVEEAERAEEIEALTVRAQGVVQAAERKADCLLSEARALADDVTEEMRSALTRVNDLISALTIGIDVLPASNVSADGSNDKLGVGRGHVDVPALVSAIRKRSQKGSIDYTEQGKEGRELVTSQTGEGAPSQEKEARRSRSWKMKKQGWLPGILSGE